MHPKIETIQYLDFSVAGALPWASLIERIREIETDTESSPEGTAEPADTTRVVDDAYVQKILGYLDQRGYQMASFERLRRQIAKNLTDERFEDIITNNKMVFRPATLRGGKPGLAKLVP